ncbi:Glycosyl transferase, family 2 domain protein, partial [mine drainage metagenome]
MNDTHIAYEVLGAMLMLISVACISYLAIFRAGYAARKRVKGSSNVDRKLRVSVVVPIYNEDTEMIRAALDSVARQKGIIVDLIVVIKAPRPGQIEMIKGYANVLNSVNVIRQGGKPSHNQAFIIGFKHVKTEYTSILCSDATIKDNYLARMVEGLDSDGQGCRV